MCAHVLFIYKTSFGKGIKCEACQAFHLIFAMSLINSIIQSTNVRLYLSFDIKITLKSHFCCKNVVFFCHYVRKDVIDVITFFQKSVNH